MDWTGIGLNLCAVPSATTILGFQSEVLKDLMAKKHNEDVKLSRDYNWVVTIYMQALYTTRFGKILEMWRNEPMENKWLYNYQMGKELIIDEVLLEVFGICGVVWDFWGFCSEPGVRKQSTSKPWKGHLEPHPLVQHAVIKRQRWPCKLPSASYYYNIWSNRTQQFHCRRFLWCYIWSLIRNMQIEIILMLHLKLHNKYGNHGDLNRFTISLSHSLSLLHGNIPWPLSRCPDETSSTLTCC